MTKLADSDVRRAADHFIEEARADFERAFSLMDVLRCLVSLYGADCVSGEQEGLLLKHFNDHYDLVRWPIGGPKWSFIPEH